MQPGLPPIAHAAPALSGSLVEPARRLPPPTPRAALTLAASAALVAIVLAAFGAVKPFVLGVLLVYLLTPPVERLARTGVPRAVAVLLVFAVVIAALIIVAALALAPLVQQVRLFIDEMPAILTSVREAVVDFYAGLNLAPEVRDLVDQALGGAASGIRSLDIGAIVAPLVGSLVGVLSAITAYAILPAWLFFLLKDRLRLADALELSLPVAWRGDAFAIGAIANRVFGNWVRGQLLLGTVVGVASYVGLLGLSSLVDPVFGRYAVLLAIIAGLLELVPFIGPIIAAIPAVLIGLTVGPDGFLAALVLYTGIQQLENNILVPKIQGDAVELHPSAVMFALVVGAALGGILGAIVSLPIAAAARDVFRYLFSRLADPPAPIDESLAAISPSLVRSVRRSAVAASETRSGGEDGQDGGGASAGAAGGGSPAAAAGLAAAEDAATPDEAARQGQRPAAGGGGEAPGGGPARGSEPGPGGGRRSTSGMTRRSPAGGSPAGGSPGGGAAHRSPARGPAPTDGSSALPSSRAVRRPATAS